MATPTISLLYRWIHCIAPDLHSYGETDASESASQYTEFYIFSNVIGLLDSLGIDQAPLNPTSIDDWRAFDHIPGVNEYIHDRGFKKDVPLLEGVAVMERVAHFPNQVRPDEVHTFYDFFKKYKFQQFDRLRTILLHLINH